MYLKDIAYEKIKKMIILEEITGPTVSEQELVKKLGMSRTPIREALQRLQNDDKFLEISPKRGIYIREITISEVRDLMDIRLAIELYSMNHISDLFTDEHLSILEEHVKYQEEMEKKWDIYEFLKSDLEYHEALLNVFGNEEFIKVLNNISDRLLRNGMKVFTREKERIRKSFEAHKLINNYLRDKNFEAAAKAMEEHIIMGKRMHLS
ncbi:GntR family transcriptional regulator [Oceanobacillus senegalensis]|uniref:GntR family transcriptional regulator n=1 Tax=Oceanobacillus senegalensis TaxID=1936063 RepID=UPI000A30B168|nr:GntR family transcriptional regulator [Oceanobacillus senegalensis]